MNDNELRKKLGMLGNLCGRPQGDDALDFTAREFAALPEETIRAALRGIATEAGAWRYGDSLLAAVLAQVHGTKDEVATLAWVHVGVALQHSDTNVAFQDPAIAEAVQKLGGLCWLKSQTEYGLAQERKNFMAAYLAAARAGGEAENNAPDGGLLVDSGTLCGRRIGSGEPAQLLLPEPSPEGETKRIEAAAEKMSTRAEMLAALDAAKGDVE
mgnify:CR=1 FL=1